MKFNKILEYQEADKKLMAIEQEFYKSKECQSFMSGQNKLKSEAVKLEKVVGEAKEISLNEKKYTDKVAKITKELSEIQKVVNDIADSKEAEHYVKRINSLTNELASLEKDVLGDKTKSLGINKDWAETMKHGQDLSKELKALKPKYDELFNKTKEERAKIEKLLIAIEKEIPSELMASYIALRKDKKFPAFVEYDEKNPICPGCRMELEQGILAKLKKGGDYAACSNCGRIIFIEE